MSEEQLHKLQAITKQQEHTVNMWTQYWKDYSTWQHWEFWLILAMLVIPLIMILFLIDKAHIFRIGFYGFNIHVWFTYSDMLAVRTSHVIYPYQMLPTLPVNFSLDASLVPVCFMLVYQWCLHRGKNTLIYGVLLSAAFAFILKPVLVALDLLQLHNGMNYFLLFLNYLLILVLALLITALFSYLKNKKTDEKQAGH